MKFKRNADSVHMEMNVIYYMDIMNVGGVVKHISSSKSSKQYYKKENKENKRKQLEHSEYEKSKEL